MGVSMIFDERCSSRDQWRLATTIVDDVVAGRSQWAPIAALKPICQVNGGKGPEAGQGWNILEDH